MLWVCTVRCAVQVSVATYLSFKALLLHLGGEEKKMRHSIVTCSSFPRFSSPQWSGNWKQAKGWGHILHRPLHCHFSCHTNEWEWCLFYPLAWFLNVSNSTSYSKIFNNNTIKTLESHKGIVGFFSNKHSDWRQLFNDRLWADTIKHIQKKTKLASTLWVFQLFSKES